MLCYKNIRSTFFSCKYILSGFIQVPLRHFSLNPSRKVTPQKVFLCTIRWKYRGSSKEFKLIFHSIILLALAGKVACVCSFLLSFVLRKIHDTICYVFERGNKIPFKNMARSFTGNSNSARRIPLTQTFLISVTMCHHIMCFIACNMFFIVTIDL